MVLDGIEHGLRKQTKLRHFGFSDLLLEKKGVNGFNPLFVGFGFRSGIPLPVLLTLPSEPSLLIGSRTDSLRYQFEERSTIAHRHLQSWANPGAQNSFHHTSARANTSWQEMC